MGTSLPRRRFTECVVCGATLIFPGLSANNGKLETNDVWQCPVCGQGFSTNATAVNRPISDDQRLEEFFARYS